MESLPHQYPMNYHEPIFWEFLGRAVATFGFLENVLARSIFAFTATRKYSEDEIEEAFNKWLPTLEKALKDPLGALIVSYERAVRGHPDVKIEDFDELIKDLKEASKVRNVICHGSWGLPDKNNASVPFFVSNKMEKFETSVDIDFLNQLQSHATDLSCSVINTVTHMGWKFPGGSGPGSEIWQRD